MELNEKVILDALLNSTDINKRILLLRLYDEYQKYQAIGFDNSENVELLNIKASYEAITKKFLSLYSKEYSNNLKTYDYLRKDILMLDDFISNFDMRKKKKVLHCMYLITKLECLLQLPVSFPSFIEVCIEKEINSTELDSFVKKKRC